MNTNTIKVGFHHEAASLEDGEAVDVSLTCGVASVAVMLAGTESGELESRTPAEVPSVVDTGAGVGLDSEASAVGIVEGEVIEEVCDEVELEVLCWFRMEESGLFTIRNWGL